MTENSDSNTSIGRFRFLALSAALITYLLVVVGGIVRVTGSGLGCPDWPTCYGRFVPPERLDSLIEYSHRAVAGVTALIVMLAFIVAWRRFRHIRLITRPLAWTLPILVLQALLGAIVVWTELPAWLVAIHLMTALLLLGLLIVVTVMAFVRHLEPHQADRLQYRSPFARIALGAAIGVLVVLVSGAYVAVADATYACSGWPLCNGQWIPNHPLGWIHMIHRLMAGLLSLHMIVLMLHAWRSQRSKRAILSMATLTVVLFFAQVLVGALKVSNQFPVYLLGLHVATAAAVWASAVILAVLVGLAARSPEEERAEMEQPIDGPERRKDLLNLTKPIIVALLLVTTYSGMVVGAKELPSLALTFWVMLGGALAAGGSGAVNQYIDRELDQRMTRTSKRPIASGRMTPAEGLAFGLALLVVSFYIFASFVNLLSALLVLAGMIYYIFLYSMWLKHATVQNIVIGGGAGAIPPLVGWAAATGNLGIPALFLFAIIFMWTPPHFWALALVKRKDYERAGVPMLPVVRGEKDTRAQIFIYTLELVALTLLMPILGMAGTVFLLSALALGGWLILVAWRVWRQGGNKLAWAMYRYSSMYLALLFAALVVDALL